MLDAIAIGCLFGAVILLYMLSVSDLKTRILPNEIVLGFATLGLVFHMTTMARFLSVENIVLGGIMGFSVLFVIRVIANRHYKEDALGLGDVKFLGAAGIWLGPDGVLVAMAVGALIALLHGFVYGIWVARRDGSKVDFSRMKVPAGPGFAGGILVTGILEYARAKWGLQ
jgi:leader peptidase (prepilin peptidase) / N-methyltransferase